MEEQTSQAEENQAHWIPLIRSMQLESVKPWRSSQGFAVPIQLLFFQNTHSSTPASPGVDNEVEPDR